MRNGADIMEKSYPEIRAINRKLRFLAEPKDIKKSREILSTKREVIGTPTKHLRSIGRELWHSFRLNTTKYFDLCLKLWEGSHEEQMVVVYSLFQAIKQEPKTVSFITNILSPTISDWAVADSLGKVVAEYFCTKSSNEILDEMLSLYDNASEMQKRMILSFLSNIVCCCNDYYIVNKILYFIEKQLPMENCSVIIIKGIQRILREMNKTILAKSYASILYWINNGKINSQGVLKGMIDNMPLNQKKELEMLLRKKKNEK